MLNNDVFQCVNVIVYRMEKDWVAMFDKATGEKGLCAMMLRALGHMQAFGLGMLRVISRNFACGM